MSRSGNKCLIYGLMLTTIVLLFLHSSVNGKLIFCKYCKNPRHLQQTTNSPEEKTDVANIIRAPSKCKPDEVLDRRNNCRRLVKSN